MFLEHNFFSLSQESADLKSPSVASASSAVCNGDKKEKPPRRLYRPQSSIDVDRLLRIKSDIQLNITKKVDHSFAVHFMFVTRGFSCE